MEFRELRDIVIASVALAVAFAVLRVGGIFGIFDNVNTVTTLLLVAFITVPTSFVFHELGHRYLARKYKCYAEFRMWPFGLALALITGLSGFGLFAAPGAVYIHPKADMWGTPVQISKKRMGLISLIGPAINVALAGIFYLLLVLSPAYSYIFSVGISINLILALFNMIPFPPLDGSKVFTWNKKIWLAFVIAAAGIYISYLYFLPSVAF